ncbi:hypothetical protein GCM10010274_11100 [Streptomyces lavendofoliae]|uniref:Uncharacterized protein n=1 Tax=Streptomyces lavendofoliae TaxID=67314 RepID=A0A918HTW6_9ACTN|nr:hypothetical protein GCM10010274_11100 [Streptomyces lavendofoliae]
MWAHTATPPTGSAAIRSAYPRSAPASTAPAASIGVATAGTTVPRNRRTRSSQADMGALPSVAAVLDTLAFTVRTVKEGPPTKGTAL